MVGKDVAPTSHPFAKIDADVSPEIVGQDFAHFVVLEGWQFERGVDAKRLVEIDARLDCGRLSIEIRHRRPAIGPRGRAEREIDERMLPSKLEGSPQVWID